MKTQNPWFRLYTEMVDDEKLRLLAFEDRWHYVALLCCKNSGLLDREQDRSMMMRKLGVKLGLASADLDSALLRLSEVGLITLPDCQPVAWEKRQYLPNKGLPGSEDENDKRCYVYFIAEHSSDRVKIGFSKNPWARLKNLQTANSSKMDIVCHLRTSGVSEAEIHRLLSEYSVGGEWYLNEGLVADCIAAIKSGSVTDAAHLEKLLSSGAISQVAKRVATTVVATTDTDTDTDTKKSLKAIRPAASEVDGDFELAWSLYPKRAGGNSKAGALKAWAARRKQGVSAEEMISGVRRYAAYIAGTGKERTEYVKQAETFFGTGLHFQGDYSLAGAGRNGQQQPRSAIERVQAANQRNRERREVIDGQALRLGNGDVVGADDGYLPPPLDFGGG